MSKKVRIAFTVLFVVGVCLIVVSGNNSLSAESGISTNTPIKPKIEVLKCRKASKLIYWSGMIMTPLEGGQFILVRVRLDSSLILQEGESLRSASEKLRQEIGSFLLLGDRKGILSKGFGFAGSYRNEGTGSVVRLEDWNPTNPDTFEFEVIFGGISGDAVPHSIQFKQEKPIDCPTWR
jgi:hypothetical protein